MATTSTPELQLVKATPGTSEPFNTATVNANYDKIDTAANLLRKPNLVRVKLDSNVVGVVNDVYAHGGWSAIAGDDPFGLLVVGGGPGGESYLNIPITAFYSIQYRCNVQNTDTAIQSANYISTTPVATDNTSIARDSRVGCPGGDGLWLDANEHLIRLTAGTRLYWGNFNQTAKDLVAIQFGSRTKISLKLESL